MAITNRPDLTKRQTQWQDWRNAQYEELQNEEKFVANNRRGNENKQGTRYASHDNDLLSREVDSLNDQRSRYERICLADRATKDAYWRGTEQEWETALNVCEQLMRAR